MNISINEQSLMSNRPYHLPSQPFLARGKLARPRTHRDSEDILGPTVSCIAKAASRRALDATPDQLRALLKEGGTGALQEEVLGPMQAETYNGHRGDAW